MMQYPSPPPARRPNPAPWIVLAVVGVAAAGLLGFAVGRSSATATVQTRTVTAVATATETEVVRRPAESTTEAASRSTGIPEGTHVVGRDVEPGEYRTEGPEGDNFCYWSRLSDTTGTVASIIANDATEGATTVTILPTDRAFKTSGCKEWTKVA